MNSRATALDPMNLRLIVFDWDGTLMDSVGSIVACMEHAAEDLGLGPIDRTRVRETIGLGLADTQRLLGLGADDDTWQRIIERYRHLWFTTYRLRPTLFDGAADTLRDLARHGYLLAVATGKSRRGLDRDLESSGLGPLFHATRTVDEAASKPSPDMLLGLIDELGAQPATTLMVGDTTFDLDMAHAAGAHSVAVASGTHPRDTLLGRAPLVCLERVTELTAWMARRTQSTAEAGAGAGTR